MTIDLVPDFVEVLSDYKLLEPRQLEEVRRDLQPRSTDPQALAHQLVMRGWLTTYQVEQVLEGKGKDLVLGPYRLLEPLGEGGMGQVFRAIHGRLGRVVALKVIRPDRLAQSKEAGHRFQREARVAASMSHPNVVLIYDTDEIDGRPFIAMEYVQGIDLAHLVEAQGPLPVRMACDYIRQAALGLQHAHERDMVHRDIKPSNIFVTLSNERSKILRLKQKKEVETALPPPGAVVKILDMGLARLTDPAENALASSLTQEGSVVGTPDYIAPEQALNSSKVDIRADLYSLGCTFYFMLTGWPPFPQGTPVEKLLKHQMEEPQPVEELRPEVPPAVRVIVRKLMAKRPEDRYPTPAHLAEVLTRVLVDPGASLQHVPQEVIIPSPPAPELALPIRPLTEAVKIKGQAIPETTQVAQESGPVHANKIALLKGHRGWVMALAFAPNHDLLASGGVDGMVRVWKFTPAGPQERLVPSVHSGDVNALAFAPDNLTLASGSGALDGFVWLWNLAEKEPEKKSLVRSSPHPIEALAFSTDGKLLATGGGDRIVRLWDVSVPEPKERMAFKGHGDYIKAVAFSSNGKLLASASMDGTVRLWSLGWRFWSQSHAVLQGHWGAIHTVAFAPDGKTLASGSMDQNIILWDLDGAKPQERTVLQGHKGAIRLVMFTPESKTLVSVGTGGLVIQWDVASGTKIREWVLPGGMIGSAALTADGHYLATGQSDGCTGIYRLVDEDGSKAGE